MTALRQRLIGRWVLLNLTGWLGNLDSNQDKQSQSLLCYRYTIPQKALSSNKIEPIVAAGQR